MLMVIEPISSKEMLENDLENGIMLNMFQIQ